MTDDIITKRRNRISVVAEWTDVCNLRCHICPITRPDMRPLGHMSIETWQAILDACRREGHFVDWAHFFGEPLAWKHLFEGVRRWRDSGLSRVGHLSTNGLLLTDDKIECLAESKLDYVRICLDTLRPDVYEKLRGSRDHAALLARIESFLRRAPKVLCQIQLLRSSLNPDESPNDVFRQFGRFRNLSVFVSDCLETGGDNPDLRIRAGDSLDPRTCSKLDYEHCVVTWDGQIGLCCLDYALQNRLGHISEGSISDVFLGERAEDVRRRVRAGDYSMAPYCPQCPMGHEGARCYEVTPSSVYGDVRWVHRVRLAAWRWKARMKNAMGRQAGPPS